MKDTNEIEQLLSEFFKTEAPAVWPRAPRVEIVPAPRMRISSLGRSRFVLAASLLAMLVGGWLLAGRLVPQDRPASFEDSTATRPPEMKLGK